MNFPRLPPFSMTDVNVYFARQQINERLAEAKELLPVGVDPKMGPISTGLGEIYMWTVEYQHPKGAGASTQNGLPGWQPDGSYLTPEGHRLKNDAELASYLALFKTGLFVLNYKAFLDLPELIPLAATSGNTISSPISKTYRYGNHLYDLCML